MTRSLGWDNAFGQYKWSFWIIGIVLAIVLTVGGVKLNAYFDRLSDKDFAAIEEAARNVFKRAGIEDVNEKSCRYRAPGKYSSIRLYCGMELAGYTRYVNDEQAIQLAKTIESEIKKLGDISSYMSSFYDNPSDAFTNVTVNLAKPLPQEQCLFTIASGRRGGKVASRLPSRTEDDLIGLSFSCSAESREEYFPVTYRQGL